MKQITLRENPVGIERMIKREAKKKGGSLNKANIALVESTGAKEKIQKKKSLHHDLDHLCGIWTKRETEEFLRNLDFQRRIDDEEP